MTSEIIEKVINILAAPLPSESDVQHLFSLLRKLIEQLPKNQRQAFSILRFYCDWTVHSKIDRSAEGALVLEKLHAAIITNMHTQNNEKILADLSTALSLDTAMYQINSLIRTSNSSAISPVMNREKWKIIVLRLLEIISNCPLRIDSSRRGFAAVIARITANPIKGNSVIEEVAIIKVLKSVFGQTPANETIFCLRLTSSDTTQIVAPLTPVW